MRRIPLSRRSHVVGFTASGSHTIEHESALERDFVMVTRFLDPGARITSQPLTIFYEHDGRRRRYTPDFRVVWSGGRPDLVEVKYRADLRSGWPLLRPKFAAARDVALAAGGRFRIATERGIRGPLLDNARRLLPLRDTVVDERVSEQILKLIGAMPVATLGRIVEETPGERSFVLGTVWRLLASGRLSFDPYAPLVQSTRLAVP